VTWNASGRILSNPYETHPDRDMEAEGVFFGFRTNGYMAFLSSRVRVSWLFHFGGLN